MGIGVTVARLTLDQLVKVRILYPQFDTPHTASAARENQDRRGITGFALPTSTGSGPRGQHCKDIKDVRQAVAGDITVGRVPCREHLQQVQHVDHAVVVEVGNRGSCQYEPVGPDCIAHAIHRDGVAFRP